MKEVEDLTDKLSTMAQVVANKRNTPNGPNL